MNFPNPFTEGTTFSIEHNQPGRSLQLELAIFDVMGRPVRQIRTNIGSSGTRNIQVQWDGTGSNGAKLPKGIYIYHLKLNAGNAVLQTSGRLIRN
jgi:flagellar hook assembly protein FlgD